MSACLCVKVLDWIENHGEAFLSKHTGVGKSLHRARALQKRHEDFEEVAQVRFKSFKYKRTQANLYVVYEEKSHQYCIKIICLIIPRDPPLLYGTHFCLFLCFRTPTLMLTSCWKLQSSWLRPANVIQRKFTRLPTSWKIVSRTLCDALSREKCCWTCLSPSTRTSKRCLVFLFPQSALLPLLAQTDGL